MKNEVPTTEKFLPTLMDRSECKDHDAPKGVPCFHVPKSLKGGYFASVCNKRARKAGFVGKISPQSLNRVNGAPRFSKKK